MIFKKSVDPINSILFTSGESKLLEHANCHVDLCLGVWAHGLQAHTQIAVHNFAVVNLSSHGTDLLQLVFLGFNSFFQFLKLFIFRDRLLLATLLLL